VAEAVAEPAKAEEAVSCKVKLLESITDENGELIVKFEYDEQNRIVKIYERYRYETEKKISDSTTITYNSADLITMGTEKYVKKGNTINIEPGSKTLTINKDGYVVKNYLGSPYTYQDGNLIKEGSDDNTHLLYSYDDKKSPFSNSNTPKWLIQELQYGNYSDYAGKNNVVSKSSEGPDGGGSHEYKYEYDSEDFPIKKTEVGYYEGEIAEEGIAFFTYRLADCK